MKNNKFKAIFLDIDGVLNNEIDDQDQKERYDISPRCMKLLNFLIQETGADVIVSSTWRHGNTIDELQEILESKGFLYQILDFTPRLGKGTLRGNEIRQWIIDNEKIIGCRSSDFDSYVILDDDGDMLLWQKNNFILVDSYCGLTPNIVYRAKYILNGRH